MKKHVLGIGIAILSIMSVSAVYAANPLSDSDVARARAAWAEAIRLSKERIKGNVCEADAYQSSILEHLGVATSLSGYLKKEAIANKHLKKALAGNLMYFEVTGRLGSPAEMERALSQAYFESMDGGALGPSRRLQLLPGNLLSLRSVSMTEEGQVVTETTEGTYELDQGSDSVRLTIQVGPERVEFTLEKNAESNSYILRSVSGNDVNFANEPDECSA